MILHKYLVLTLALGSFCLQVANAAASVLECQYEDKVVYSDNQQEGEGTKTLLFDFKEAKVSAAIDSELFKSSWTLGPVNINAREKGGIEIFMNIGIPYNYISSSDGKRAVLSVYTPVDSKFVAAKKDGKSLKNIQVLVICEIK
ncbi:MAG: hypothetical protein HYS98_03090 [Deltaproteobacteria bacterium]|nr:hypothetical protein [Deltaproteobacteria bacterium]